jgi:hypothetical protein
MICAKFANLTFRQKRTSFVAIPVHHFSRLVSCDTFVEISATIKPCIFLLFMVGLGYHHRESSPRKIKDNPTTVPTTRDTADNGVPNHIIFN